MSQNHFTLSFPLTAPAAAKSLAEQLPALMPGLFRAMDDIGRVHYEAKTNNWTLASIKDDWKHVFPFEGK